MPFTPWENVFDPETLEAVHAAFDRAWAEVSVPDDLDERTARNLIARRIVDAAIEEGIRDPARMKAYALRVFRKPE